MSRNCWQGGQKLQQQNASKSWNSGSEYEPLQRPPDVTALKTAKRQQGSKTQNTDPTNACYSL